MPPFVSTEQDRMLRNALHLTVFFLGLAAALWIGAGYIGHHAVGAVVAFVIALCYCVGGMELLHYRRATDALARALADAGAARDDLADWLQRLPEGLRGAVRLRIEGSRTALPGPGLTPYLVGLLVLLGMLGTLLGMMATLRGTGLALQSATDLQAIRGSLASPVEGLAVAFGTSIAGVAASAMLGLLSALLRRERQTAAQRLDQRISSDLQQHGPSWQRGESLRLLQGQAAALPALVSQLQALVEGIQQASRSSHAELQAQQASFLARHDAAQERLATQLEQSLLRGVQTGTEAIGNTLQPMLRGSLDALQSHSAATQDAVTKAVERQLTGVQAALAQAADALGTRFDAAVSAQRGTHAGLIDALGAALEERTAQQTAAHAEMLDALDVRLRAQHDAQGERWAALTERHDTALKAQALRSEQAAHAFLEAQNAQTATLLQQLEQQQDAHQSRAANEDAQRLQAWTHAFATQSEAAAQQWSAAGAQATEQQQRICDALERSAQRIGEEARAQSSATIAEIARLLQAASDAPRAAAEVVSELRERLSDSLVRDTALLEERAQLLGTLGTLMGSIETATGAQRAAVDRLIEDAAGQMQRTGERFGEQVDAQAQTLQTMVGGIADAVAGTRALAEGLEGAVNAFADTSGSLAGHLQQLAGALDATLARSDEQLAYYVAQAREVVDLSLLSQKQITEELRQLGTARGADARA